MEHEEDRIGAEGGAGGQQARGQPREMSVSKTRTTLLREEETGHEETPPETHTHEAG